MGITSALTGVLYVVFAAKGKLAAYAFGVVNCILYAIISYDQTLYGEVLLNLLYYLPLQFVGFYVWKRHLNHEDHTVQTQHLSWRTRLLLLVALALSTATLGWILAYFGDEIPYIDAFTTAASVFAMTLSAQRYLEQWYLWMGINTLSIYMWLERYLVNGENSATLLMWIVFLLNAIYGLIQWTRK